MHSHSKNEDRRIAALIREQDRLQEELSAIQKELSLLYVSKQRESKAALSIANLYPLGQTVRIVNWRDPAGLYRWKAVVSLDTPKPESR